MTLSDSKDMQAGNIRGSRQLYELLQGIDYTLIHKPEYRLEDSVISMVHHDSREVIEGSLFVAVSGSLADGHNYIMDAVGRGCVAIIVQQGMHYQRPDDWSGWLIEVEDSRKVYGTIAENFFGNPAAAMTLIGVTGTNGKTTITYLLEEILEEQGCLVGVIGTVNYRYKGKGEKMVFPSPFTTPEAVQLQKLLYEMANAGVQYVIMEVSSHALSQFRIGNIRFDVAAFTNLSRDHLDYHQTMEEYFQAKTLLFSNHLKKKAKAVISTPLRQGEEGDWSGRLSSVCRKSGVETLLAGPTEECGFRVLNYSSGLTSTEISLVVDRESCKVKSPLVGHFNVDNILTSLAVVSALGLSIRGAVKTLEMASGAPGRLQRVKVDDGTEQNSPVVFVDYAHTPDALKQVLTTLEGLPHRELYCVFGCGGDRDAGKRPVMGSFAGCFADVAIITDDNPRTEDPDEIRKQIAPGVVKAGMQRYEPAWLREREVSAKGFVEIGSRRDAIKRAICSAGVNDIVLIAGKGHETYQLTLQGKQFFDDCMEAEDALLSWNCLSVAKATGGELYNTDCEEKCLGSVSTDSRTIEPRDIFVALRGENFDGHEFLDSVVDHGSGCLVVERDSTSTLKTKNVPRVEVSDTLRALGDLAAYRRSLFSHNNEVTVAAITGSCGKTTVKEMVGAILQRKWPAGADYPEENVLLTRGNLNNLIGLPLSLLPLSCRHKAAVLEMGMNVPGEIRRMAVIADPDICCITNIHGVHLEGLGDIDGVGAAKEELFEEASEDAMFVVNLDDEQVFARSKKYNQKKLTYSIQADGNHTQADVYASAIDASAAGVLTFMLHRDSEQEEIHLYTAGVHNVSNAVAAAAIATAAGATMQEIAAGLADFRPADRRMVLERGRKNITVINDTYNANPVSMAAALDTLVELSGGRAAAVLSDMLELGEEAERLHFDLGRKAGSLNLDYLLIVGQFRDDVRRGALDVGLAADRVFTCGDKNELNEALDALIENGDLKAGDWLLVKGSRGGKMETVVEHLIDGK